MMRFNSSLCPRILLYGSAEGGTSGKNTSTDQRQTQLTTGTTGANSPNTTATEGGSVNSGLAVTNSTLQFTDAGAIEKAFNFGDNIAGELANAFSHSSDAAAATVKSNTDFLSGALGAFSANTDAGQAANSQKTLLYLGAAALAVLAIIFLFRR